MNATALAFTLEALGLIDSPGGCEWERRVREGWNPAAFREAIREGVLRAERMRTTEINRLWEVKCER